MDFLASDLLRGRDTGSVGHEVASQYIASEFAKMGILPAGDDGTYMQRITFKSAVLDLESPEFSYTDGEDVVQLDFLEEFTVGANINRTESAVSGELVFAGFGIDAPFLEYSDFNGLDLKGKIAVVLSGRPNHFPSEEGAHYSRKGTQALVDRGAIGVIRVVTPVTERIFPFTRAKEYISKPRIRWVDADGAVQNGFPEIRGSAGLSMPAAKALFKKAGMDLEDIYEQIERGVQPAGQAMGLTATISMMSCLGVKAMAAFCARSARME